MEREQASQPAEPARLPPLVSSRAPTPTAPAFSITRAPTSNPAPGSTPGSAPATATMPARRIVGEPVPSAPAAAGGVHLEDVVDRDMMIVISKLKKYIKDRSGMNCSDAVAEVLSDHVRVLCDDSIRAAGRDERKTVLDRDVPRPRPR